MLNIFSIPDKEKNHQGYMMYMLTMIWSVILVVIVSLGFFLLPEAWPRWVILISISFFIAFVSLSLNRYGYTSLARWSLTIMLWLFTTISCYTAGGIIAPGIFIQMSVILTAGFLLGWRGGLFFGLLSICTDFGFVYLELSGNLPRPKVIHTPVTRWVANIISFSSILALQYYFTNHLRTALAAMQREIQNREAAEKQKDEILHNLKERVKELKTMNAISRILQDGDTPYHQVTSKVADLLPQGWQYPDITAARVCIAETEYATKNYAPSAYSQQAEMKTASGTKVFIEVVYLQPMPPSEEGPFLKEERDLINMLAEIIKIDVERKERTAELKDYKYALDISSIVSISNLNGDFIFVNNNFCEVSKYSSNELIGKHHSIVWSKLHSPAYFEEMRSAMQNGKPFRGEFCNTAKDGTVYWTDNSIIPFLDDTGNVYQYLSIGWNITMQKEMDAAIQEQAETFRAIIENTSESIYFISPEFKLLLINTTAKKRLQLALGLEAQIGADFRNYLFPGNTELFYSMFNDALKGYYRQEEMHLRGINDKSYWIHSKSSPVYNLKDELIGVRFLSESIDDKKQAEIALRESEEKFRSIVEQSLVGIFIIQGEKLVYVNPGFEKIFAYSKEDLLDKISFEDLVHKDDLALVLETYHKRIINQSTDQQYIFRGIRSSGAIVYLEVIACMISFNEAPAVIGTLVDITSRVEEERRINQAVFEAQERERLQIGMELHDNVQQILAGSGLFLAFIKEKLDDKDFVIKTLDDLKKYNMEAIDELRRLSHQLAPSVQEGATLEDKIKWLIQSLNLDEKFSVTVHIENFKRPLDDTIQLAFYRILQEQLSNIIKHAGASAVTIDIRAIHQLVYLQVKDNGKGFDVNTKKMGIGLENIRRRVQMLKGKVDIISFPGKGCEVNVEIPLGFSLPN